ncbi:MAG TPA: HD domain-containing protein [Solirubrobacterales bacterium]|nr:HD domain-containing protein [Solirubrobacterales bacterium]
MRQTEPYGLPEGWLDPGKAITDPIHGDIRITRLEQLLLDTPPMQRLRGVRQLGTTHLVYPGATHSRFAHSLGAVRVVQTLLDTAIDQRNGNHPEPDLFDEWERQAKEEGKGIRDDSPDSVLAARLGEQLWQIRFLRRVSEATVLARLGALLHDIAHLPFGHTIEDDLRLLRPHDRGRSRFDVIWTEVIGSCEGQIAADATRREESDETISKRLAELDPLKPSGRLFDDLQHLILSSEEDSDGEKIEAASRIQYPFVADMVGNTICADLLDYLLRDHVFTGLPIRLGERYLSSFYITPNSGGGLYRRRMALLTHRQGVERRDIVSETLKHLRYRYELQERALVHHTKLAADAMVGKLFELWIEDEKALLRKDPGRKRQAKRRMPKDFAFRKKPSEEGDEIEQIAHSELEFLLRHHGDDGVLEVIAAEGSSAPSSLARDLLSRRLYKPAASAVGAAAAEDLYEEFGPPQKRRELEAEACSRAKISRPWNLVIWIPDPDMRLKLAELLVNNGKGIAKFKDTFKHGEDIYAAHKALWNISVFVHPSVPQRRVSDALAYLGRKLDVSWDTHADELGSNPEVAPEHLAAIRALKMRESNEKVQTLIEEARIALPARGGAPKTQEGLDNKVRSLAEDLELIEPQDAATPPDL